MFLEQLPPEIISCIICVSYQACKSCKNIWPLLYTCKTLYYAGISTVRRLSLVWIKAPNQLTALMLQSGDFMAINIDLGSLARRTTRLFISQRHRFTSLRVLSVSAASMEVFELLAIPTLTSLSIYLDERFKPPSASTLSSLKVVASPSLVHLRLQSANPIFRSHINPWRCVVAMHSEHDHLVFLERYFSSPWVRFAFPSRTYTCWVEWGNFLSSILHLSAIRSLDLYRVDPALLFGTPFPELRLLLFDASSLSSISVWISHFDISNPPYLAIHDPVAGSLRIRSHPGPWSYHYNPTLALSKLRKKLNLPLTT